MFLKYENPLDANLSDLPLMEFHKRAVPKPLTTDERNEYGDLVIEFNSKYPTWKLGFNFITGELIKDV